MPAIKTLALAAAMGAMGWTAAQGAAQAQDLAAGETSFRKCKACHMIGEGAKNLVGPQLNGLDGRKSGTIEGYTYSESNKNSGIVWDEKTFDEYIANPRKVIPNTKMVFAGIPAEGERKNLWAYLSQFKADGAKK